MLVQRQLIDVNESQIPNEFCFAILKYRVNIFHTRIPDLSRQELCMKHLNSGMTVLDPGRKDCESKCMENQGFLNADNSSDGWPVLLVISSSRFQLFVGERGIYRDVDSLVSLLGSLSSSLASSPKRLQPHSSLPHQMHDSL